MTHRKQTLLSFIGLLFILSVIKMAGDYRYVTQKEQAYKPCERKYERVIDADHVIDCNGDTIKYDWQILKRK